MQSILIKTSNVVTFHCYATSFMTYNQIQRQCMAAKRLQKLWCKIVREVGRNRYLPRVDSTHFFGVIYRNA